MIWLGVGAIVVFAGSQALLLRALFQSRAATDGVGAAWEPRVAYLESRIEAVVGAVREEADRAERAAERARYHARKSEASRQGEQDEPDAGTDVRGDDEAVSGREGLYAVPGGMASVAPGDLAGAARVAAEAGLTPAMLAGL